MKNNSLNIVGYYYFYLITVIRILALVDVLFKLSVSCLFCGLDSHLFYSGLIVMNFVASQFKYKHHFINLITYLLVVHRLTYLYLRLSSYCLSV